MIIDIAHSGNVFRQSRITAIKTPLDAVERCAVMGIGESYPKIDWGLQRFLVLLPVDTEVDGVSVAGSVNQNPSSVRLSVSGDSSDGIDGVWSEVSVGHGTVSPKAPGKSVFFNRKCLLDTRVRWLRIELDQGLGDLQVLYVDGHQTDPELRFETKKGDACDVIDAGRVQEGGEKRKAFWVRNTSERSLAFTLTVHPLDPKMRGRFWLVGPDGPTRRMELGLLSPGKALGPLWISVQPKIGDPADCHRAFVRIARRENEHE